LLHGQYDAYLYATIRGIIITYKKPKAMKNSVILFLLVLFASGLLAAAKPADNFVIIGEKTYYCDKVQVGPAFTRAYVDGKLFFKFPTNNITAYADKGRFFEYLPVMNKDGETTGWAFMEFLASRDGDRLYRYCSNCLHYDPVNGKIEPTIPTYRYYIFNGGRFVSVTDDYNLQAQVAVFGVKVV
jgi:hypothetical protein